MKLLEVVDRALKDEAYARELKAKAEAAYEAGTNTDEWTELMKEFAENPKELARLRNPSNSNISLTSFTTGTRGFTITTTTTTGSYVAPDWLKEFVARSSKSRARKKTVAKAGTAKAGTAKARKSASKSKKR
jgi:hypothetical protein